MLSFEVPYVSSGELKSLGFGGTEYEDCVRMVPLCSPSVLHANTMKYANEMLCYPLKFPKFEVGNWKALVLEELGMEIAWEWFMYVAQVYYKRIQWNMQKKYYVFLWSSISLKWWTEKPWFGGLRYELVVWFWSHWL